MEDDLPRMSVWHGTADAGSFPPMDGDRDTQVAVVGAGITGLTTALLLAEAGVDVTLLEAREVAAGTTGGTTGKVTSQHGVVYHDLIEGHGRQSAKAYADMNQAAIGDIADICERYAIDAAWTPSDAYVFADSDEQVDRLRKEAAAAQDLGLPAELTEETELPLPVALALRYTDQAQFHPVAYANGVARTLRDRFAVDVHCSTRVRRVSPQDGGVTLATTRGNVTAQHVVLATLLPITVRGFEFARARPSRTYGIAATIDGELPEGMYISAGEPSRSIRHYHGDDAAYLIVVGEAHEVGHETDTARHYAALEEFTRAHYDVRDVRFRWSAQDYLPDDRLPFIGTTGLSDSIHVATGFQKWGLTNGTAAARILTDVIGGHDNPYADVFAPTRASVTESAKKFVTHNLDVAKRFVADRAAPGAQSIDAIAPGTSATVRIDGQMYAVSKDQDGHVTSRSAVCPHLGCIVQWNNAEASWDCPCHGSRFTPDGDVLEGPATEPLEAQGKASQPG